MNDQTPSQTVSNRPPRLARFLQRRRWLILSGFLPPLLVLVGCGIAVQQIYGARILPNITVQGIPVGQLRPAEARALLAERYVSFLQAPITMTLGDRQWTPDAAEIGLELDIDGAIDAAYAFGRDPDRLVNMGETRAAFVTGHTLSLAVLIDEAQLAAYLAGLAEELAIEPQDAALTLRDGQAVWRPSRTGQALVTTDLSATIHRQLATLTPQTITLTTQSRVPTMTDSAVRPTYERLQQLLASPITIGVAESSRTWSLDELASMVRLGPVTNTVTGNVLSATLDLAPLQSWLESQTPSIHRDPVEPQLRFENGRVRMTTPGANGTRLDVNHALAQIEPALWAGSTAIAVPLTDILPQIRPQTLDTLGIVELIAEGRSDFSGSAAYRIQNIRAGAARMNGVLLAPNAEFSFNTHVGDITEAYGFTEGYAIIGGRTQLEWGGGVCQVSTTVFRAAFWAGVPITERNQHSYRIRWYEVYEPIGMDAAIFTGPGGYDFRFINDTGAWILMQSSVDLKRNLLSIQLYGTKPDRTVIQTPVQITNEQPAPQEPQYVADPELPPGTIKQTDTKRSGMDVRIGRRVEQNGQVLYRDTFLSRYRPWPDIFALGPGAQPPTPLPSPQATPSASEPLLTPLVETPTALPTASTPEAPSEAPDPGQTPVTEPSIPTVLPSADVPPSDQMDDSQEVVSPNR